VFLSRTKKKTKEKGINHVSTVSNESGPINGLGIKIKLSQKYL
jgi:hypothetical protein